MIVPNQEIYNINNQQSNGKKMHTISLSNCFLNDVNYRMHSAFRVNLKPRQSYACMNTKLLEQRPNSKYTSSCSRVRPTTRNTISTKNTGNDMQSDDEYERIGTPSTLSNDHMNYQEYTLTRDAFRPSNIRKFNNKNSDESINNNSNSRSYITSKFGYNIEESKMRRNIQTGSFLNKKSPEKNHSFANIESESRISYSPKKLKSILKTDDKPETTSGTSVRIELDEDELIENSLLSPDINNKAYKTTSDIFNEIYSEINLNQQQQQNNNKNKMQSKSASIVKSTTCLNDTSNIISNNTGNISNRSKYLYTMRAKSISEIEMKKIDDEINGSQSSSLYLNKMREEEFLEFLKEYRITKSLQPTASNEEEEDYTVNTVKSAKTARKLSVKPIKTELLSIRTQFLNLYVDKDFYSKNTLNHSDLPNQSNNKQQQQHQQPNYFYNYLKTKILLKQYKNNSATTTTTTTKNVIKNNEKKEDSFLNNKVNSFYYENNNINNILNTTTTTKINLNKSKEKELKNQLNILNFPSIENC
jgi:hypothetical protein